MSQHPFDDPRIVSMLFYPRADVPGNSRLPNVVDGTILLRDGERLGYRLYQHETPRFIVLYFHGNGEVASDYDGIAPMFLREDAALRVVDYRGYGWSTGTPLVSNMLPDAEDAANALPEILGELASLPLFLMGRSLGSASATHLAVTFPERFRGLIVESGFADTPSVFKRLGIHVDFDDVDGLPLGNTQRVAKLTLPLLVIHGEDDTLLPVEHGQQLFDACPHDQKQILRVPRAGHNNLLIYGAADYFNAIRAFMIAYGS